MPKNHGVNKKILHINLESGESHTEQPPEEFYQKYIGGKSLGVYYLLHHLKPGVDSLSPENVMVFSTGPLVGAPLPGQGRSSVVAKSPLTSGLGSSEAGGYWGPELKRAGFDAIVVLLNLFIFGYTTIK